MDPGAVGWDWIGMNLDDGSALMAFRMRRADGSTLWSGGSHRRAGAAKRDFSDGEVVFTPGRAWTSAASSTRYPVEWQVSTPSGAFGVRALLDDQELDSRISTGAIYWEGLALLVDGAGRRVGRGYLEMTGYAGRSSSDATAQSRLTRRTRRFSAEPGSTTLANCVAPRPTEATRSGSTPRAVR